MIYLPGEIIIIYISSAIWNASTNLLSSVTYIIEVVDVLIYSIRFVRIPLSCNTSAIIAVLTWLLIPLPSV